MKIKGQRELSGSEVEMINKVKEREKELKQLILSLTKSSITPDGRCLAIAKTHLETGFMFLFKSIAKPEE